jgi:nicotinamidase/pyrazinamidase
MNTVFFDVDTQLDFLYPAGALYVPGAEEIVSALAKMTRYATDKNIQIVSTVDAHSEDDPEFETWKPHCVVGTVGQQKAEVTKLPAGTVSQIIVEKQKLDAFSNPNLRPLLNKLGADRYIVYGVVTELCVRSAAMGLLETGARVELVTDAVKSLGAEDERAFLKQFQERGGKLTSVAAVLNE